MLAALQMEGCGHILVYAAPEVGATELVFLRHASPAVFLLQVMKAGAAADLPAADYFLRRWVPRFCEGVIEEIRKVSWGLVGQAGCPVRAEAP